MSNNMIARIAALPEMTAPELKNLWKSLYAKEPPPFNKTYFVKRLAYRIQDLEYGVDSRPLERQQEAHARQQMDMQGRPKRKSRRECRDIPVSGTRLMREYTSFLLQSRWLGTIIGSFPPETPYGRARPRGFLASGPQNGLQAGYMVTDAEGFRFEMFELSGKP